MQYFNNSQPIRPTHVGNQALNYRTHISHPETIYDVYNTLNMIAQVKLYWWVNSDQFIDYISIDNLHRYLFHEELEVTKRQLGMTVTQSLRYIPKKMKGKTKSSPKYIQCYIFWSKEELSYGLEWMLATWVWRIEDKESTLKKVEEIFTEIAGFNEDELKELYIDPFWDKQKWTSNPSPIDWPTVWDKNELETQEFIKSGPTEQRPVLRRVSS